MAQIDHSQDFDGSSASPSLESTKRAVKICSFLTAKRRCTRRRPYQQGSTSCRQKLLLLLLLLLLTIVQAQLNRVEVCGFVEDAYGILTRRKTWWRHWEGVTCRGLQVAASICRQLDEVTANQPDYLCSREVNHITDSVAITSASYCALTTFGIRYEGILTNNHRLMPSATIRPGAS